MSRKDGRLESGRGGWFKVYMDETNAEHFLHPYFTGEKACRAFAFLDLRGQARWKDADRLERGQLNGTLGYLQKRWNWGEDKVRKFLEELERKEYIDRIPTRGRRKSIIVIRNYDLYNGKAPAKPGVNDGPNRDQEKKTEEELEELDSPDTHRVSHAGSARAQPALRFDSTTSLDDSQNGTDLISESTFAGLVRRLNYGEEPEAGIQHEVHLLRTQALSPLEGCCVLAALETAPELSNTVEEHGVCLAGLAVAEFDVEPLLELGRTHLGQPRNASELHDRLDELSPGTAEFRPASHD